MIVLLSCQEDVTTNYLEERISEKDIKYSRVNIENFGTTAFCTLQIGEETQVQINERNEEITGVFCKFTEKIAVSAAARLPTQYRDFALLEANDALLGSLMSTQAVWMNRPESKFRSSIKLSQLRIAKNAGFNVPATIVSSDKDALLSFWKKLQGKVVTKAIHVGRIAETESAEGYVVVFTNKVTEDSLLAIKSDNFPPVLLQEAINKVADLRVVVIGNKCFTSKIISAEQDWRKDKPAVEQSTVYELDPETTEKCINIVKSLGLTLGIIDLVLDKDGNAFFLEINQQGGWLWMEKVLGLPIRDSMIEVLVGS